MTRPSERVQQDAFTLAKAHQRPGQTKEQTLLIAKGIEKGISEYKKQQKQKAREHDKQKKRLLRQRTEKTAISAVEEQHNTPLKPFIPWGLLLLSWVIFALYLLIGS
ncbi:MAG: DUF2956 domain-containing protein [Ferrimonas sp.]